MAEGLVKTVFGGLADDVPGAAVVDGMAPEGFFEIGEASPGMGG